jgi:hypothetical protein
MFKLIRKIHLYTAFVISSFLLMYFLTGAVIVMDIFPTMNFQILSEKMAIKNNQTEAEIINKICKQYDIYGEKSSSASVNGKKTVSFFRPAYRAEIFFMNNEDSVQVKIKEGGFGSVMHDFHQLKGYKGSWPHLIWALLYDLSCIALLIFAFTGVYLWWKLERNKWMGIILLFASTGITAFTIWYILSVC